jgi:hypothetical protein
MRRTLLAAGLFLTLGFGDALAADVGYAESFGAIVKITNADAALCACPCLYHVELVDTSGHRLVLCYGPDPANPHHGFRLAQSWQEGASPKIIPLGSNAENNLLSRIYTYLDRSFSFRRLEAMAHPDSTLAFQGEGWQATVLVKMLRARGRGISIERWINANYTVEELRTLPGTPYGQLATARDREAIMLLCFQKDGTFIGSFREIECER